MKVQMVFIYNNMTYGQENKELTPKKGSKSKQSTAKENIVTQVLTIASLAQNYQSANTTYC